MLHCPVARAYANTAYVDFPRLIFVHVARVNGAGGSDVRDLPGVQGVALLCHRITAPFWIVKPCFYPLCITCISIDMQERSIGAASSRKGISLPINKLPIPLTGRRLIYRVPTHPISPGIGRLSPLYVPWGRRHVDKCPKILPRCGCSLFHFSSGKLTTFPTSIFLPWCHDIASSFSEQ